MGKLSQNEKRPLVVETDLKLARLLAGNDKGKRDRAIGNFKKWMEYRASKMPFTEDDFTTIWKGLFYAMWMSDKPLIQEECAEKISKLVHLSDVNSSLLFFKCGLKILCNQWFGIDQLRLNKFLMFSRRCLRQGLTILKNNSWDFDVVKTFTDYLSETTLNPSSNLGLQLHFVEIFLEELAKVSEGNIKKKVLTGILEPFVQLMATSEDKRVTTHVVKHVFHHLMQQSDVGLEYEEKFEIWKREGYPGGSIDTIQKVETVNGNESDEEAEDEDVGTGGSKVLDPRAGHVDVELPQLSFHITSLIQLLMKHKNLPNSSTCNRRTITNLIDQLEKLKKNQYPLGIKKMERANRKDKSTKLKSAVNRLVELEKHILGDSNKQKKKRKAKKNVQVEKEPPAKKKKAVNGKSSVAFEDELQDFISKSEGNIATSSKRNEQRDLETEPEIHPPDESWVLESNFRRNSGTWVVFREKSPMVQEETPSTPQTRKPAMRKEAKKVTSPKKSDVSASKKQEPSQKPEEVQSEKPEELTPPKKQPPRIFTSEWETPLKEGETEIFVPAKKYQKRKSEIFSKPIIKGKNKRMSLDSSLVKNPFANRRSLENGEKKVKIDLKLNSSQEVHEFHQQVKNSPDIPFDANRRPSKPLLKSNTPSPINPFYKRKLGLL